MIKLASLCIAMVCICNTVHAQKKFSLPFSNVYNEDASILIGFQYSIAAQNLQLTLKDNWQKNNPISYPDGDIDNLGELRSIHDASGIAVSVAIPIDVRTTENLYFTFNPSFMFVNNMGVNFTSKSPDITNLVKRQKHILGSTDGSNYNAIELPLSIKFRSDEKYFLHKENRFRAYMIAGARYTKWLALSKDYGQLLTNLQNNQQIPNALVMKPGYLSWEAGLGIDIFLPYFKLSPEIKFNQSFGNVFDNQANIATNNKFMGSIDKGLIRNIYFGLIFQ